MTARLWFVAGSLHEELTDALESVVALDRDGDLLTGSLSDSGWAVSEDVWWNSLSIIEGLAVECVRMDDDPKRVAKFREGLERVLEQVRGYENRLLMAQSDEFKV